MRVLNSFLFLNYLNTPGKEKKDYHYLVKYRYTREAIYFFASNF